MALSKYRNEIVSTLERSGFSKKRSQLLEEDIFKQCEKICSENTLLSKKETYGSLAYEKVGQLVTSKNPEEVHEDIRRGIEGWESCVYQNFAEEMNQDLKAMTEKPKLQKGGFPCRKMECEGRKTKNTIWYQMQTRSGDEGMTTFVTCLHCGNRYTIG